MSERFWARVRWDGLFGCAMWMGGLNGAGYGVFGSGMAHRAAFELSFGPIPPGMQLDHLCRNRWCVNPAHLECVSASENSKRGYVASGKKRPRGASGLCHRGHPLSGENLYIAVDGYGKHRKCRECRRMAGLSSKKSRDSYGKKP